MGALSPPARLAVPALALPAASWSPTAARTHTSCSACGDTQQRGNKQGPAPSTQQDLDVPLGPHHAENRRQPLPSPLVMCPTHLPSIHG